VTTQPTEPASPSAFRAAVEAADPERLVATLAPDVRFRSPVVYRPYEGREAVGALLRVVMSVFEDFRYLDELRGGDLELLRFEARVGDREIEGVDLVRWNADALVGELVVMIRPLSGLMATRDAMGAGLQAAG
jgi:hypothetical protein